MQDNIIVHLTVQVLWRYEGWLFEFDEGKPFGPWPLKADGTRRKKAGKKFYDMFERFLALPEHEKKWYQYPVPKGS